MDPIKVLIVDDSAVVRLGIRKMLATDPDIRVVGEAANGLDAISQREKLAPDIITMDVNMPGMNGLETTAQIMSSNPIPILIVTDLDTANLAFEAISYGALDLLGKAEINPESTSQFIRKIKLLSQIRVIRHIPPRRQPSDLPTPSEPLSGGHALEWIIAVASSTGGPKALITLLNTLGSDWRTPIVVAQHIHSDFIPKLVEWLESVTPLVICVASDQQRLLPGHVYLSPADRNLEISSQGRAILVPPHPKEIYRPSCNALLSSVTRRYGMKSIGVILTGMGDDGIEGAKAIKASGGHVLVQDEATCAVYGMPLAAQKAGCADYVLPIQEIGTKIRTLIDRRTLPRSLAAR
ncbi:chemotaxis-specific protein-glutamate methyltransferase CheB [Candidatus Magnetaquicoccus inordinatus]|uniref:chemotaxis-specific protein-glutamate methyltransferase CheB n=1 Tax=Candidatus Magnetaquicoccus inordinatus TaxID=2496818 RepID=UPI00187D11A3|nr:chemotaxis-specific protein-glutamate methyltransferase CheB [Candidatus Magnetaquicoccus inordinatus]